LLAERARAAGLETTAYILELAANEASKDAERIATTGVREKLRYILAMQQFSGVYRCLLSILMFRFEAQD
jgi:hypothetical protein